MRIVVLDLDGALPSQPHLRQLMAEGRALKVDARDLAPRLRIVASPVAAAELRERIEAVWSHDEPMLVFYGSGDFHHLCALFLGFVKQQVSLIQFDNHPDWTTFPKTLNCGSWVNRALELDHVDRIVTIGPSSDDFVAPERKSANLQAIRDGRLEVHPWRAAPSRMRGAPVDGPGCRTEDGHVVWDELAERSFEDFVEELDERLSELPLWITIDKDVLRRRDAATNWDQSELSLAQVLYAVRRLSETRRVVGIDVCGDYSRARYGDLFRLFLDITDHPKIKRPGPRRLAVNDRTNARLVRAFGDLLPMTADHSILFEGKNRVGVLLIHGLGGTPIEMKSFGRQLCETGATVYCCQLAGHCGSEDDLKATTRADWYASVLSGLALLEERCDTVVVGGLSMGACLAGLLAAREPARVKGVIMLAPTLWYDGWSIAWYGFLLKLLIDTPIGRRWRFVEHEPYGVKDERIRSLVVRAMMSDDSSTAGLLGTPSQAVREVWRITDELKALVGGVTQPTLIVHAREDDVASVRNAFWLQKHLGGRVESLILDDSYHLVTVDRQRGLAARRAADFVRQIEAEAGAKPRVVRPVRTAA